MSSIAAIRLSGRKSAGLAAGFGGFGPDRFAERLSRIGRFAQALSAALWLAVWPCALASALLLPEVAWPAGAAPARHAVSPQPPHKLDRSGRKRVGVASFYARKFAGRKMANGQRMNPKGNNAASRTLPLGTRARVKNLETGRSAVVKIEDRGPYVKGRIIDLSPSTARKIGIDREQGVGRVEVTPLAVPQVDGSVRRSVAAAGAPTGRTAADGERED